MLILVTVSPVITAFHSCCLSHHVFDQVNIWSAWVGFETAIFWQCSPRPLETQCLYPLHHGPRRAIKDGFFGLICSPYLVFHRKIILRLRSLISKWFQLKTMVYFGLKENYHWIFLKIDLVEFIYLKHFTIKTLLGFIHYQTVYLETKCIFSKLIFCISFVKIRNFSWVKFLLLDGCMNCNVTADLEHLAFLPEIMLTDPAFLYLWI